MFDMANETIRRDAPIVQRNSYSTPSAVADRTADLARVVRRALRNPNSNTPLSQAIRVAAARVLEDGSVTTSDDEARCVHLVALRLDAILSERAEDQRAHAAHRETVHC